MNGNSGSRGKRQRRHETRTRSEDSAGEGGGSQSIDPSRRRRQPGSTSPGFVDVGVYTLRVSVYPDICARRRYEGLNLALLQRSCDCDTSPNRFHALILSSRTTRARVRRNVLQFLEHGCYSIFGIYYMSTCLHHCSRIRFYFNLQIRPHMYTSH